MRSFSLSRIMMFIGFAFLYLPMLVLIIYSFNASRLVTVWGGWSTEWYSVLLDDQQLIDAVSTSLTLAFISASMALVLGTMAGFVLTSFKRSRSRSLLSNMVAAPLVMPEVITGLSLLLLFVQLSDTLGWPAERGMATLWIAHSTFCSAYVAVIVSSRLRERDRTLEEAAMDLGATPLQTFFLITIPGIAPGLIAGWLLAFSLSLDDLVIASFASGPGSTTLPMLVFSSVRMGVSPKINALASMMLLSISLLAIIAWLLVERSKNRNR